MVMKLRKTLSDRVVKRLSQIIDRSTSRPSSTECSSDSENDSDIETGSSPCDRVFSLNLRPKNPSFIKRQRKYNTRRVTVTGCSGHQIVETGVAPWYYNDHTETTVDRFGVKTTSFCASEL